MVKLVKKSKAKINGIRYLIVAVVVTLLTMPAGIYLYRTMSDIHLLQKSCVQLSTIKNNVDNEGCVTDHYSMMPLPSVKPWNSIGGCGAGGSGGGSGDGIKWIGYGVTGGLIDVEILPKYNFGQNFSNLTIAPRFSFKPTWTTTMGVSIPIMSKQGEVQHQTNQPPSDRTTGGTGDLSVDISKSFGMQGQYSMSLALSFPTGQYDIKRGTDFNSSFLPSSLQKGGGIYSANFTLGNTIDVEDGIWLVDVSYSHPFNVSITGKNSMLDEYFSAYADRKDNARFYYNFKPYGENDFGDYSPPGVSTSIAFGYRGIEHYVYSGGFTFSAPLGVVWIRSPKIDSYDPIPDPDHQAWSAAFVFGIEFVRDNYPVFAAVSLPIHDRANPSPKAKWDWPDWKDFGQQWTFAIGIKTTVF